MSERERFDWRAEQIRLERATAELRADFTRDTVRPLGLFRFAGSIYGGAR